MAKPPTKTAAPVTPKAAPAPAAKTAATGVTSTKAPTPTPAPAAKTTPVPTLTKASSGCCGGHTTCATPNYEQIAQRAYEIWVAKGRPQGQDIENWKQAEAELTRGKLVTAA